MMDSSRPVIGLLVEEWSGGEPMGRLFERVVRALDYGVQAVWVVEANEKAIVVYPNRNQPLVVRGRSRIPGSDCTVAEFLGTSAGSSELFEEVRTKRT
jgi:hypothetical protein